MVTRQIGRREAIFWVALGVVVCFLGWRIKIGAFSAPGPGFFALIAGLAILTGNALQKAEIILGDNYLRGIVMGKPESDRQEK